MQPNQDPMGGQVEACPSFVSERRCSWLGLNEISCFRLSSLKRQAVAFVESLIIHKLKSSPLAFTRIRSDRAVDHL